MRNAEGDATPVTHSNSHSAIFALRPEDHQAFRGCADVDECATCNGGCWQESDGSDAKVTCTTTPGSFTCGACPTGYVGGGHVTNYDVGAGCINVATGCDDVNACTHHLNADGISLTALSDGCNGAEGSGVATCYHDVGDVNSRDCVCHSGYEPVPTASGQPGQQYDLADDVAFLGCRKTHCLRQSPHACKKRMPFLSQSIQVPIPIDPQPRTS